MRALYTEQELRGRGLTPAAIRWGEAKGRWRRVENQIYGEGPEEPTPCDRARAAVIATRGVASGSFAAVLLGLDAVECRGADLTLAPSAGGRRPGVRRRILLPERVVEVLGIRCTDGAQTLVDLAADLDDLRWEQALESALRLRVTTIAELQQAALGSSRGIQRIRRVLGSRPRGAPPTESLLETLMVQLARTISDLGPPMRQVNVVNAHGDFVARVDLAWPDLGLFIELDGQHHRGQPLYDARRETAIVAATGWLCGRFTWREVVHLPVVTARRLDALVHQARRRPLPQGEGTC